MSKENKTTLTKDLAEMLVWLSESGNIKSPVLPHPYGLAVVGALQEARKFLKSDTKEEATAPVQRDALLNVVELVAAGKTDYEVLISRAKEALGSEEKMKDHEGMSRCFVHGSKSWYWSSAKTKEELDDLLIGMYAEDGGTAGEFSITWIELAGRYVPQLRAFDDSWSALGKFDDLLAWMAEHDNENVTPDQVAEFLKSIGVIDKTQPVSPYGK